ncbi:MAG: lysophospholipid acyltransferase family protein [Bacteroidales bacterium]|nr:lysophospholipid acyltransferase family protein [Bacteroidales bacterium]
MKTGGFYIVYAFIWLLTLLPLRILYIFSDFAFLVVYYLIGYRKKVVQDNLRYAFPDQPEDEIKAISKRFFHHFCDFLIESVKLIHLSQKEIDKRFRYINADLFDKYYEAGKSVVLVLGHYGNWEWVANCTSKIRHEPYAIYKPLRNEKFDQLLLSIRTKWQMAALPMNDVIRLVIQKEKEKVRIITSFLVDQTPPRSYHFWIRFMNRETPFYTGPAKIARKFGHPVIYMKVQKVKRGYYTVGFFPLFDEPAKATENDIITRVVEVLEETIREKPEYWLWSHRRWKHNKENLPQTNN